MDPGLPLVVAANRDERYERPAVAMAVHRSAGPRILGGRDLRAGGTWLAVNEHGVVAGLTNQPSPAGRDPSKRSRGELPLLLATHADAGEAVAAFVEECSPADFNPCWLLVGDRRSLFFVEVAGERPTVRALGPGLHVLENRPLEAPSAKADHVRARLAAAEPRTELTDLLTSVLADHTAPDRPLSAACVHTDGYGTRSSVLVCVPHDRHPEVWVADGPPCRHPFQDVTNWWENGRG